MGKFKELNDFDKKLLDGIKENAKGHSKKCIFSAVEHLKMAYMIKDVDSEMAMFRVITAEEEVARAIFLILKEHEYKNSKKIKDRDHRYKQALSLFIGSIQDFFYTSSQNNNFPFKKHITLSFNEETKLLELRIPLKNPDTKVIPIPPLNFEMSINGKPYYFQNELNEFTLNSNSKSLQKLIDEKVNFRNRILYADTEGTIKITAGIDTELDRYYNTVFKLIKIYGLIYPYKYKKSNFIQNTLNAFLFMMMELDV